jgi:ElaB/YqjD/DUF883 family membrane-anchored ribosome-binding protein
MDVADHEDIVVRGDRSSLDHRTEQDRIRRRLEQDRERLRAAVEQVREAARDLTPAGRIRQQPYAWVFGGFAVGLALGWLTAGRSD